MVDTDPLTNSMLHDLDAGELREHLAAYLAAPKTSQWVSRRSRITVSDYIAGVCDLIAYKSDGAVTAPEALATAVDDAALLLLGG